MQKIIGAAIASALAFSMAAWASPGDHARGSAAVDATGAAAVETGTMTESIIIAQSMPAVPAARPVVPPQAGSAPMRSGVNPGSQGRVNPGSQGRVNPGSQGRTNQGSQGQTTQCRYGTMMHHGSLVCAP